MDDATSLIFKMSAGGRDNRMCSMTSGGSSDPGIGHIAADPRFALVLGTVRPEARIDRNRSATLLSTTTISSVQCPGYMIYC
jgi:hypothetical protein